jgi:hypothetical protein
MPDIGTRGVTGVINGKLYVVTTCYEDFVGYYDTCDPARVLPLQPGDGPMVTLPRPHNSYEYGTGGVLDGKFYVTAGLSLEMYDPATNQWTVKAPPPSPTHWGAAGAGAIREAIRLRGLSPAGIPTDPSGGRHDQHLPPGD